jgi:hypothetical protein
MAGGFGILNRMMGFERFSADDLALLRMDLQRSGLDSFQVAELFAGFLSQRGYGVSNDAAREAVSQLGTRGCTLPCLQEDLERLAYIM